MCLIVEWYVLIIICRQQEFLTSISAELPPAQDAPVRTTAPDRALVSVCFMAVREGLDQVASYIASTYLVEVSQILAQQAENWLPNHVRDAVMALTFQDLCSKEALQQQLGVCILF